MPMIWNNECRKTRRLLALEAGNDLDEREGAGVKRHLAVCPHCRDVRQGLQQAQRALDSARPAVAPDRHAAMSVWPGISRHIQSMNEFSVASGWREWLPTAALAAACVAVIAVLLPPVRSGGDTGGSDSALTVDSVSEIFGSDSRQLQRVSLGGGPRFVDRYGRIPLRPPANPDSYRNF